MQRLVERVLAAIFEHSESWGMVWFGLIFWGSVILAIAESFLSLTTWILAPCAYTAGFSLGLLAKVRGGWL